ncbi:MAG: YcjF family protein [Candidatus Competibacterales bacterium]
MSEAQTQVEQPTEEIHELTVEERTERGNAIVQRYTLGAILPGLIPLPVVDLAALSALQLGLLAHLAKVYEVKFQHNVGKSLLSALIGGGVSMGAAPGLASLVKLIPGVGTVAGGISVATLGAATTYAVGKVFQMHFEAGGNFLNFDPEKMRAYFAEQVEEGKQVVSDMQNKHSS